MSEEQPSSEVKPEKAEPANHNDTAVKPEEKYYEPTRQEYQSRIFINECNSYIGSQLVEVFRNDDQIQVNPNLIVSTLNTDINYSGSVQGCAIIDIGNKRLLNSVLKSSDIIVYHLNQKNAQDFEYIIKLLRRFERSENYQSKRVVCISSLITWNSRRGHQKPVVSLENLPVRNSTNSFLMDLENLCLDVNNVDNGIQAFVISSGIVYGYGQDNLFTTFKRALEQTESLQIYGTGSNHLPMIHLGDLCQMAYQLSFQGFLGTSQRKNIKTPLSNYYFAIDCSNVTQSELINAIAQTVGNGKTECMPIQHAWLKGDFELMTMDLQIDAKWVPEMANWGCRGGIIQNMGSVVSEFNLYRGLRPNKIIICGSPVAGKSRLAEYLHSAYGLPVLDVKKIVDAIKEEQGQYADQVKAKIEELRVQKVEAEKKAYEEAKKKKKGKKDQIEQFDPDKVVPRLPDGDLAELFRRRLSKPDCLNKGYILDGWPKTAKQCEALFLDQNQQVIETIMPNSCFIIEASEEQVKERLKNIPAEKKQNTHWNEEATARRFQAYIKGNEEGSPKTFFESKVDIKQVPFTYQNAAQFPDFIERNGPLGFKKKVEEASGSQEAKEQQPDFANEQADKPKGEEQESKSSSESEPVDSEPEQLEPVEEGEFDLEKLTEHEKQILNEKSRPIRQYLIDNVIPKITEGLLQICRQAPRDPIQFLITFLQRKQMARKSKGSFE